MPHPRDADALLRVSRYFGDEPQVRFSVWDDGVAQAAVSLEERETQRLVTFLRAPKDTIRCQAPGHVCSAHCVPEPL